MLMFNPLQPLLTPPTATSTTSVTPHDVFTQMSSYMNSSHAHAALAALASTVPSLSRPIANSQPSPVNTSLISGQNQQQPSTQHLSESIPNLSGHLSANQLTSAPQTPAQQQQYCLKWNNHKNNFVKVFTDLLTDESLCDVTLTCDRKNLKAHKLILAACSDYFRDVFLNNPCQHPVIIIKDVRYDDLRAIIHYMYTGEVNVSYAQMSTLLTTAETLKVKGLLEVNEKHQNGNSESSPANGVNGNISDSNPFLTPTSGDDNNAPQSPGLNGYFSAFNKAKQNAKRKRSFVNNIPNSNGSAFALANMLGKNGNLAFAAAAAAALAQENGLKNGASFAAALQKFSSTPVGNGAFEDELESGDELGSHKRRTMVGLGKDSVSDDSLMNSDNDPPHSEVVPNGTSNEMIAMALTLAANRAKKPGSVHDDDEPEDEGAEESDGKLINDDQNDGMESDDEFYSDLKPIVSLDESPSPTNSNLEESHFNSAFISSGILENSLNGLPMNQMPNGKVCICHLCNLTFTAYSSLRRHMSRHYADRERYECDICRKSYSRKDYLKEHKKLKHSDVPKLISPKTENSSI